MNKEEIMERLADTKRAFNDTVARIEIRNAMENSIKSLIINYPDLNLKFKTNLYGHQISFYASFDEFDYSKIDTLGDFIFEKLQAHFEANKIRYKLKDNTFKFTIDHFHKKIKYMFECDIHCF